METPCIGCTNKVEDEYGLLCDLACGRHTAYVNYQAGIKEVVEWMKKNSQLEECDPDVMAYFSEYRWFDEVEWQSKLEEWGMK